MSKFYELCKTESNLPFLTMLPSSEFGGLSLHAVTDDIGEVKPKRFKFQLVEEKNSLLNLIRKMQLTISRETRRSPETIILVSNDHLMESISILIHHDEYWNDEYWNIYHDESLAINEIQMTRWHIHGNNIKAVDGGFQQTPDGLFRYQTNFDKYFVKAFYEH